jgi:hypothetical protein
MKRTSTGFSNDELRLDDNPLFWQIWVVNAPYQHIRNGLADRPLLNSRRCQLDIGPFCFIDIITTDDSNVPTWGGPHSMKARNDAKR